jgi:hypothetical protein
MRHHYLCTLKLGVALSLLNQTVHAQVVPGPRPTAAQCNSSVQVLSSNPRDTSALETLPGCGKAGGVALGKPFRAARSETDKQHLEELYRALGSIRDPEVFTSALSIMKDPGASAESRATAIFVAVAQHDNALVVPINLS